MTAARIDPAAPALPDPFVRLMITFSAMAASTMVAVDITIANVALPHMQAAMSAAQDQVVWVLTSYIVAGAIATPLSGWLATRYGRKPMMLVSVGGFTLASLLCGLAGNLQMIVLARLLQGACGAGLVPLSQATLLDINPPERHAKAMAVFAAGSMLGPLVGPTLGGWLTDSFSWRWVFFINLPFGALSFAGMWAFMRDERGEAPRRFDVFGFATLAIALASFQLLLDRGEQKDWFDATEIWAYAVVLGLSLWFCLVHVFTSNESFIRPELFRDRNFAIGSVLSMAVGVVAFATIPLITVVMQNLLGFSALHTGLVGSPRGVGTLMSIFLVTRLINRFDTRIFVGAGLAVTSLGLLMYARMDLQVDDRALLIAGFVQGAGGGLLFLPLSVIVFATLPASLRNEGASMYALTRNVGQSIGISLLTSRLTHLTAAAQTRLAEGARPDNPLIAYGTGDIDFTDAASVGRLAREVAAQAAIVGNVEVFQLICLIGLALIPLVVFMRSSTHAAAAGDIGAHIE